MFIFIIFFVRSSGLFKCPPLPTLQSVQTHLPKLMPPGTYVVETSSHTSDGMFRFAFEKGNLVLFEIHRPEASPTNPLMKLSHLLCSYFCHFIPHLLHSSDVVCAVNVCIVPSHEHCQFLHLPGRFIGCLRISFLL